MALGVKIDDQHTLSAGAELGPQIDRNGRLASAALPISDRENPRRHLSVRHPGDGIAWFPGPAGAFPRIFCTV